MGNWCTFISPNHFKLQDDDSKVFCCIYWFKSVSFPRCSCIWRVSLIVLQTYRLVTFDFACPIAAPGYCATVVYLRLSQGSVWLVYREHSPQQRGQLSLCKLWWYSWWKIIYKSVLSDTKIQPCSASRCKSHSNILLTETSTSECIWKQWQSNSQRQTQKIHFSIKN